MRTPSDVIVVNDFAYSNGGSSEIAISVAVQLSNLGYNVIFFAGAGHPDEILLKHRIKIVLTNQHETLKDPIRYRAAINGIWNLKAAKAFKNLLKNFRPEKTIVHIHGWSKVLSSSVIRTTIDNNFKAVISLHDYFLACPNGGFYNYQKGEICKIRPLSAKCVLTNCDSRSYSHKIWRSIRHMVQASCGMLPNSIQNYIAVSNLSAQILKEHIPESKIHIIPNPISVPKTPPSQPERNKYFVFVGRLSPEKGAILLAKAALHAKVDAIFVGYGELSDQILKQSPKFQVTGWIERKQVLHYIRNSRCLVFPSLLYETDGLVVKEALSNGIPVIISDSTLARTSIKHNITGYWFRAGDYLDLAEKIEKLKDPETTKRLGRTAYSEYWRNPYSMGHHIELLTRLYEEILSN